MPNYLKVEKKQQVIALLGLGWSYRRIEAETGVRRETVSRYDRLRRSNPAKVFPGSTACGEPDSDSRGGIEARAASNPAKVTAGSGSNAAKVTAGSEPEPILPRSRSVAAPYHDTVEELLGKRLTAQRIWQDLVEDYGYPHSYESIKRYVRTLRKRRRVVGVFHSAPGEEAQVDFFRGAPTLDPHSGGWRRPWVFRMTLCHSRHGYEEAVWDQKLETFLRLHENAFGDFGGVPRIIRHDNLKAGVVHACFYDPDSNQVYAAFAEYWGFTALPTRPRNPQENGKQERSGGYVKDNALKGRRFGSLEEHNAFLRRWNRTIARLRIHGTTRRQVWTHFLESEKSALQSLPTERFAFFQCGTRSVHADGHVEVQGGFYPAPLGLIGQTVQVRWDQHLVRLYHGHELVVVHHRVPAGTYAARPGGPPAEAPHAQRAFVQRLLGRCSRVGQELRVWAEDALSERGVRAIRLIQGVLGLLRKHPRERVLHAARQATEHRLFRYRDLKRLVEEAAARQDQRRRLTNDHPAIRPMTHYRLEDFA